MSIQIKGDGIVQTGNNSSAQINKTTPWWDRWQLKLLLGLLAGIGTLLLFFGKELIHWFFK